MFVCQHALYAAYICVNSKKQQKKTVFPELAYNDEQIHKSEKWVWVPCRLCPAHAAYKGFCPELCCNLPSQNPPVVPHQASKVAVQRRLHAAVQRAPDHNQDVEQASAAFEITRHTVNVRRIAKTSFLTRVTWFEGKKWITFSFSE